MSIINRYPPLGPTALGLGEVSLPRVDYGSPFHADRVTSAVSSTPALTRVETPRVFLSDMDRDSKRASKSNGGRVLPCRESE